MSTGYVQLTWVGLLRHFFFHARAPHRLNDTVNGREETLKPQVASRRRSGLPPVQPRRRVGRRPLPPAASAAARAVPARARAAAPLPSKSRRSWCRPAPAVRATRIPTRNPSWTLINTTQSRCRSAVQSAKEKATPRLRRRSTREAASRRRRCGAPSLAVLTTKACGRTHVTVLVGPRHDTAGVAQACATPRSPRTPRRRTLRQRTTKGFDQKQAL